MLISGQLRGGMTKIVGGLGGHSLVVFHNCPHTAKLILRAHTSTGATAGKRAERHSNDRQKPWPYHHRSAFPPPPPG
jgi:hypothetical protein